MVWVGNTSPPAPEFFDTARVTDDETTRVRSSTRTEKGTYPDFGCVEILLSTTMEPRGDQSTPGVRPTTSFGEVRDQCRPWTSWTVVYLGGSGIVPPVTVRTTS